MNFKKTLDPEDYMIPYKEYSPTPYDPVGLCGDEHNINDWWVTPVQQNRDSDILEQSNFDCFLKAVGGESEDVEVHRFGHWACGWFEILLIKPGTQAEVEACEVCAALENYPVVDEEDYSRRECEYVCETWENMSISDRIEVLKECNIFIYAARRNEFPHDLDDSGSLFERILGYW